jgi:hypothetical protein
MTTNQPQHRYEIGMVGFGVMGRNLVLNMANHGFPVAVYDKNQTKVEALRTEPAERNMRGAVNIRDFSALLRKPRAVMLLVPAGAPVDSAAPHFSVWRVSNAWLESFPTFRPEVLQPPTDTKTDTKTVKTSLTGLSLFLGV